MSLTRRSMLKLSAAAAGSTAGLRLSGPAFSAALGLSNSVFQYGVASGDPLPNSVVIWTRVTPDPSATPGSGAGAPTLVDWVVATDSALTATVASGSVTASASSDHTVKVDVPGLAPGTTYYYGFRALAQSSDTGTTRTTALQPARVRFALVSCSNYPAGYFTPYRFLAQRCDLDFVLHVGDYIYEYENGNFPTTPVPGRLHDPPTEIISLSDYRRRHAIYKSDQDLRALHAAVAWITTIDDHETANDNWAGGAQNHQVPAEGNYIDRRNNSYQAYLEWMPIRLPTPAPTPTETRFYRRFEFGTLADLIMLDLRQYRDQQVAFVDPVTASPTRAMAGATEATWLFGHLDTPSPPAWRLVGNSVQFMQIDWPPGVFSATPWGTTRNVDAWDGYPAQRLVIENKIAQHAADYDVVMLTGDIHSTWAAELPLFNTPGPQATGYTSIATEFVCSSVTSDNFDEIAGSAATSALLQNVIRSLNPHVKLLEGDKHGCSIVDVDANRVQCDWYYVTSATATDARRDPNATLVHGFSYQTRSGTKLVEPAAAPLVDDCGPAPMIPESQFPILLPITAAAAIGLTLAVRRRMQSASADDDTIDARER